MVDKELIRLSKLMSERGLCSRREADRLIADGLVEVNGELCSELGSKVTRDAKVQILKKGREKLESQVTILLNKPTGYVSTPTDDGSYPTAIELIEAENQIHSDKKKWQKKFLMGLAPTGRLDIDSRGLMIFTQDGVLAKKIIGENSDVEKEYLVRVQGDVSPATLNKLEFGLELDGRPLKRAKVTMRKDGRLSFVLKEGRNRQIRRMCDLVNLKVTGLKRIRVGEIYLADLPDGRWRFLRADEHL